MSQIPKRIFRFLSGNQVLTGLFLRPFYFLRFVYRSLREGSTCFYRYYPGYHGSTLPSGRYIRDHQHRLFDDTAPSGDGVDLNRPAQEDLLHSFSAYYGDFSPPADPEPGGLYAYRNEMFGFNDAFILYSFLRHFKPRRVIEVGSGHSSALMLDTARDWLPETRFTFIDPYSTNIVRFLEGRPSGNYRLLRSEVQDVDIGEFSALQRNDFLFIDSSHVVKIGSDLSSLLFSVIPSLQEGVIVHFHDIWYPLEYPRDWISAGQAYNEIYFVRAFLQYNRAFEILFYSSYMEKVCRTTMEAGMPGYFRDQGRSLWLRKIA